MDNKTDIVENILRNNLHSIAVVHETVSDIYVIFFWRKTLL